MQRRLVKDIRKGDSLIFRGETYRVLERVQQQDKGEEPYIAWTLEDSNGSKVEDTLLSGTWGFFETPDA